MKNILKVMVGLVSLFSLVACGADSNDGSSSETETGGSTKEDSGGSDHSSGGSSGASTIASISYGEISDTVANVVINKTNYVYKAAMVVSSGTKTISNLELSNDASDSNVIVVCNGAQLNLDNLTINKSGDGSEYSNDEYNFYGLNSAIVCIGEGSTINIKNTSILTNGEGANAIFSFGGAVIELVDIDIKTESNSSRGLYSTYKGVINATNINIVTQGAHCAPLATDRGGGYVTVYEGDNYVEAHGDGSPCIYSTGDIEVSELKGYSEKSQAIVIEGKNIVEVEDSTLTSDSSSNDGIMIYQSMSGDASDDVASQECSTLSIVNSEIIYNGNGSYGLYLITNTTCVVNSNNVVYTTRDDDFIWCGAARWGTSESNGGIITYNSENETINKNISTNTDNSKIYMNLGTNSTFTGSKTGNIILA